MKKIGIIFAGLLILSSTFLSGCISDEQGTLTLKITDAPPELNISKALITIPFVEVHFASGGNNSSNGEWVTVINESMQFDLILLENVTDILGSEIMNVGIYTQIRLHVSEALVTIDAVEYDLKIPVLAVISRLVSQKGFDLIEEILDELNTDFTSMFILNTQPVESFVLDAKNESLVGLQNPVMAFYFNHGYEVNMDQTTIVAPDHLSIEFAFMQSLIYRDESEPQKEFMKEHLISWVIPYMLGMKSMAQTPFYKDMCDFIVEFLAADYEMLNQEETS